MRRVRIEVRREGRKEVKREGQRMQGARERIHNTARRHVLGDRAETWYECGRDEGDE